MAKELWNSSAVTTGKKASGKARRVSRSIGEAETANRHPSRLA